jgi:hypothetical protein
MPPGTPISRAVEILKSSQNIHWANFDLCPGKNACKISHAPMLDGLVAFVKNQELFSTATHIVIESQPHKKMQMVAAGLYALLRDKFGSCTIVFQAPKKKLAWPGLDVYAPEVKTKTYLERKKGAVSLMSRLLADAGQTAKLQELSTLKKKDDAADSFLHALCYMVTLR